MGNDVNATANTCGTYARIGTSPKLTRQLHLLSTNGSLAFIAVNVLESVPCTENDNQYVVFMDIRCLILTREVPTGKTSPFHMAIVFFKSWIIPFRITSYVLTGNGVRFTSRFSTLYTMIRMKHLKTTAYHPQTNRQVERCIRTIVDSHTTAA